MSNFEKICSIVHEVTGFSSEAIANDPCICDTVIDSLDITEIIHNVEEEFDLIVENEESLHTLNDILHSIRSQIAIA